MTIKGWLITTVLLLPAMLSAGLIAQGASLTPDVVWHLKGTRALGKESVAKPHDQISLVIGMIYRLAALIDLAEQHNPETRVAWEEAKSKIDQLGIARSSLYPTLTAVALAVSLGQLTGSASFIITKLKAFSGPYSTCSIWHSTLADRGGDRCCQGKPASVRSRVQRHASPLYPTAN
jgi:hypothetical protein